MDADGEPFEVPAEVTKVAAGVERAMTRLIKLLASPDGAVRAGALGALAPVSRTTVLMTLGLAATDRAPEVRAAAARVVWGLETPRAPE
ncbi:MAG: hypothetical protein LC745_03125, partial [Planctomycetia bacterium]|nr:hypothetical protein [Planctomycetia bacterium]